MTCDCQKLREVAKIVDYTERSRGYPTPSEWEEIVRVARQSLAQSPAAPSDDVEKAATEHMRTQNVFESETIRVERAFIAGVAWRDKHPTGSERKG